MSEGLMTNHQARRMVSTIQRSLGVGTKQVKGRKWYVCPCCGAPGLRAKDRRKWARAAKKWDRDRWRRGVAQELDETQRRTDGR